jgi:hypothetical protein
MEKSPRRKIMNQARENILNKIAAKKKGKSKYSPEAREYVSKKIKKIKEEGYDAPGQAAAIALEYARKKGLKVPPRKKKSHLEEWQNVKEAAVLDFLSKKIDPEKIKQKIMNALGNKVSGIDVVETPNGYEVRARIENFHEQLDQMENAMRNRGTEQAV